MADEDTEPGTGPFTAPAFRIAVLFLLACTVTGVLIAVIGAPTGTTPTARTGGQPAATFPASTAIPTTTSPPPARSSASEDSGTPGPRPLPSSEQDDGGSVCGLAAGDQDIPVAAPPAAWQIVGGRVAAPFSPTYGPAVVSADGIGGCFAHSPTGALFAMLHTVAFTAASPDQTAQVAVVTQRGSHTNLYDAALAEAHREDDAALSAMPANSSTLVRQTLLGFTFIDYAADRATIAVAVGIGDPSRPQTYQPSIFTGVVLWERGDWRFVYSEQTAASMAPILSQGQYVRWAA